MWWYSRERGKTISDEEWYVDRDDEVVKASEIAFEKSELSTESRRH